MYFRLTGLKTTRAYCGVSSSNIRTVDFMHILVVEDKDRLFLLDTVTRCRRKQELCEEESARRGGVKTERREKKKSCKGQ